LNTKYGDINLITEYPKNDHIIRQIIDHLQKGKLFALCTNESPEQMAAMIYNPKNLKALHTSGNVFEFTTRENFTDNIRLTLIAYTIFMSEDKFGELGNKIILIE